MIEHNSLWANQRYLAGLASPSKYLQFKELISQKLLEILPSSVISNQPVHPGGVSTKDELSIPQRCYQEP